MVLAGTLSWGDSQSTQDTFEIVLGTDVRALLAVAAGILFVAPRVPWEAAAGFLTGTTAAAGIGALTTMGVPIQEGGTSSLLAGWWLAFLGQALVAATGLLAIAMTAWRAALPRGPIAWRDPATWVVLATGLGTTLLLFNYAAFVGSADVSGSGYYAAMYYIWGLITVAIVLLSLVARPSAAGRLMALAWAVAVVGWALAEWVYLSDHQTEPKSTPGIIVAGMLLAVAAGFIGRRGASEPGQSPDAP
jgi:hypothetical protein